MIAAADLDADAPAFGRPIRTRDDLAALLRPLPLPSGETLRFGLAGFKSVVTRELLQIRMRRQAQVFGTGDALVATAITADGGHLEVDGRALMAANAAVAEELGGAPGTLRILRLLARGERAQAAAATSFARALGAGMPSAAALCGYVDANTAYQELGALKFCMPAALREHVAALVDAEADALLAPERPSLWSSLRLRELALARARLARPAACYRRALHGYRRSVGYLGAEDVDFAASEQPAAIDARIAAIGTTADIAAAHAALAAARARDRAERRRAAARFAAARPAAPLVALVLLARTLAAHEDLNRRAKLRLLRDLRDVADHAALAIATASLLDIAAACAAGGQEGAW